MSRSGYTDDCEHIWLWRNAVARATRGNRGQSCLRDLLAALDGMPKKRLVTDQLVSAEGEVCALGALGRARGMDLAAIEPCDYDAIAEAFGIARALACEIEWMNDEVIDATPEGRWTKMRDWVASQITDQPADKESA